MHELGIAKGLIKQLKVQLDQHRVLADVKKVTLKAGILNAIIPESLQFHFDTLKNDHECGDSRLKDAALIVENLPIEAHCSNCNTTHTLNTQTLICPDCSGCLAPSAGMKSGQELWLDSIEVADESENRTN